MKRKDKKNDSDNLKAFFLVSSFLVTFLYSVKLLDSDKDEARKKRNLERLKAIYEQIKQIEK